MGEVLCVASWNEKKQKQLIDWVNAKHDRYVVWVVEEEVASHPRMYRTSDNDLSLRQVALDLLYLPFVYEDPSHPALQKLACIQTELHWRSSDFLDQGVRLLTNYRAHLQKSFLRAKDCFGKFESIPAIICGAAPSLKQAIPFLKKYRDQFLIIGCGAGMEALISAGVEPHLAVHVDPDPHHQFSKTKIPLFFQLRTSHEVVSKMQGPHFLMAGSGVFPLETWIEEKIGLEPSSDGGWTAVTRAAALTIALGSSSIYFAGVDFMASSMSTYAKGVEASTKGSLMQVTLKDGSTIQTRSDWLLAADWLNTWIENHPDQKWGIVSQENPLMPALPAVDLQACLGPEGVSSYADKVFSSCEPQEGKEIWKELANSLKQSKTLVDQFLTRLQAIFPQSPVQDEICSKILRAIEVEDVVQKILNPIWDVWEYVLKRQPENHPDALLVHRILLLKTVVERFYA